MNEELQKIKEQSIKVLKELTNEADIYQQKSLILGKKGSLTKLLKNLKDIPTEERPAFGKLVNEIKKDIEFAIEESLATSRQTKKEQELSQDGFDPTLPGRSIPLGRRHPLTLITDEILGIFTSLGFETVEGPEIELDFFNFEALNIPKDHPARDMHDTFYISDEQLLRTHTSPVQIRTMKKTEPPLKIICPGKVYRCDSDVSHTPMFHQIEGLMVDENIAFSDLKGLLTIFIHQIFDKDTSLRFRPSFFPFTEPSAEVDIQCVICRGSGCRVCSGTGWLEILGCGMVNPKVFENVGYDSENITGLAFGLGVERIAMLRYGINDIRLYFENDYRFLSQF
jgi:phenylalanyl-tRNA synthetase alpha chain